MNRNRKGLACATLVVLAGAAGAFAQTHYYATGWNDPWFNQTNDAAMNTAFGNGNWSKQNFNTMNVQQVFSKQTECVFIDGGDSNAIDLANFLGANLPLIENWVAGGGGLFLNAAPNVGGDINFGFGGVKLLFNPPYNHGDSTFNAVNGGDAIWNGPFTPCGTAFTGSFSHHATLTGGGTTPLAVDSRGENPLVDLYWGSGHVVFGGLTTDNFWNPQPNAANLKANILSYACRVPTPGAGALLGLGGLIVTRRRR